MFRTFCFVFLLLRVDCSSIIEECIRSTGVDYRGQTQTTSLGNSCLNWNNTTRDYDVTAHADTLTGVGDHSFCRNPDASGHPWCYVFGTDGTMQREDCLIPACEESNPLVPVADLDPTPSSEPSVKTAKALPAQGGGAAVQPVMGVSQRVRTGPKQKKDLGTLGYVLGILMMAIIIILGAGITVGYFYKRGRDLKKQHDQRVYEREMQRITLPLSAFSNPTCELVDENTIVITAGQTPGQEPAEGADPLMGQAGTPGA
ncbi:phosphoinositide-3-kinase-interacting protein 1 [Chanos chanos]|uniref:Phosphoinositide-3-kinase-interacting protein 1 n=1 Tax=Chanos chanos TaxID=29144 RepID=A0A6J2WSP9_CHACN|nr:phosphoinositide-3-kinase-interacting protein 1 [Chanos chanos]